MQEKEVGDIHSSLQLSGLNVKYAIYYQVILSVCEASAQVYLPGAERPQARGLQGQYLIPHQSALTGII